jgi:hypothetical protein
MGNESYRVAECLKNMRGSFSKDEALRWGFCVKTAFVNIGYNPEIDEAMNKILVSKDIPQIVAMADERPDRDSGMPPILINKIFKTEFNQEQLKHIWHWIKDYSIDKLRYPYQYLSLLLFMEYHHSLFLQKPHISNTDMQDQMMAWYTQTKIKCSADSLGTYRNGFFDKDTFSFVSWVISNGEPSVDYEFKKDQSLLGFQALNKLCNDLELNLSELKI